MAAERWGFLLQANGRSRRLTCPLKTNQSIAFSLVGWWPLRSPCQARCSNAGCRRERAACQFPSAWWPTRWRITANWPLKTGNFAILCRQIGSKSPTINLFDIQNDSTMIPAIYPLDSRNGQIVLAQVFTNICRSTPPKTNEWIRWYFGKGDSFFIDVKFQGLVKHKTSPTNVQPGKEPWLPRVPSHWRWSPVDNGSPHLCHLPPKKGRFTSRPKSQ